MAITETTVTTDRARLSYAHLFEPYANNPGQEAKYSVTVLVPKTDYATKQRIDAAETAAKRQGIAKCWNGTMPPMVSTAIHDGDGIRPNGEPFGEECKGHWVFTASSKQPPQVVDIGCNPIINQSDVYSGCYARVCVVFFPYNSNGNRGVGIGLQAVQKIEDGEPLGGRISAAEAFGAPLAAGQPMGVQTVQPAAQTAYPQHYNYQQQTAPTPNSQQLIDPLTGAPYITLF